MEVILLTDIEKVGYKHDVTTVKNGYGRNFLIPKGFAIIANAANMKKLDELKAKEEAAEAANLAVYQEMATKLAGAKLTIGAKSGTSGKIFGSITSVQIANALKEQMEMDVERRKIELPDEMKEIGTYKAIIKFHPEVEATVDFDVVKE